MGPILGLLAALAVFAFIVWLVWPTKTTAASDPGQALDAENARDLGFLTGLLGGSVADAAIARFALKRFEETHGRKATMNDAGTVAGLMKGHRGSE